MPIITIYQGASGSGEELAQVVAQTLGYRCVGREVLVEASRRYGIPEARLNEIVEKGPRWWERLLQDLRPYRIALQAALCEAAHDGKIVYHGHLVQCLTLLVLYPEYTTTKDTKSTKEEKKVLESGRFSNPVVRYSCASCAPLKIWGGGTSVTSSRDRSIASFQHGVLESRFTRTFPEASLRTWMPAIHAGMTKSAFSFSVGERKLMKHSFVYSVSCFSQLHE
jgi:hypothetical protein